MFSNIKGKCSVCSVTLPHKKATCPDCSLEYDDCEDWSGPAHSQRDCIAHSQRDCIAHLRQRLELTDEIVYAARLVLLGWLGDYVDGGRAWRESMPRLGEAFDKYE